jgi:hypothetical protein
MELCVGLMLILLGILNLTGLMRWINDRFAFSGGAHLQPFLQGDATSASLSADNSTLEAQHKTKPSQGLIGGILAKIGLFQTLRPLIVGIIHGLAGSAAVALLVLTRIRNPWWALVYLLVFGIGTIVGMMLITSAIAAPIAYSGNKFAGFSQGLAVASGLISIGFGCFLAYQNGVINGLLTAQPHWIPH